MNRIKCMGKKKDGTPCSLYAIQGKKCCRFHVKQPQCQKVPEFYIDESSFDAKEDESILSYVKKNFPFEKYKTQTRTDNLLEDFAAKLVKDIFVKIEKRKWNCLVAQDGYFGLVGSLNEEYETDVFILTIDMGDTGFMIYVF